MPSVLAPLATDLGAARRFARRALEVRARECREPAEWASAFEDRLASGTVEGRLLLTAGVPVGLVCWSPAGRPLGLYVQLLYAAAEGAGGATYAELLSATEREIGPVAFLSGPLAGLDRGVEERLLRPLGFRRYSRSEMVLGSEVVLPEVRPEPPERFRPATGSDLERLADLHRRAYHDRFDRYLFLESTDEVEDSLRGVREILDGRWGALAEAGSWVCERDGTLAGAVLSVHSHDGALVADVMVDPELQGRGVGRRVLATALRALRESGERRIFLNVTEGNASALQLYRALGFVRSLGPTSEWYRSDRIPAAPSPEA